MKSSTKFILENHTIKLPKKFVILYWVSVIVILDHVYVIDTPCENQALPLPLSHTSVQNVYAKEYAHLNACGHICVCKYMNLWKPEVNIRRFF